MVGLDLLPEDIFAVFGRIGFSRYEAKAYATLCSCGRLKMGALAKYSTVPQSKIYSVVETLEEKGAVLVSRAWEVNSRKRKRAYTSVVLPNDRVHGRNWCANPPALFDESINSKNDEQRWFRGSQKALWTMEAFRI